MSRVLLSCRCKIENCHTAETNVGQKNFALQSKTLLSTPI